MIPNKRSNKNSSNPAQSPVKRVKTSKEYILLVSRFPKDFQLPFNPNSIITTPKIRNQDGGFFFVKSLSLSDHNDAKSTLAGVQNLKIKEKISSQVKIKKTIVEALQEFIFYIKGNICRKIIQLKKILQTTPDTSQILLQLSEICDNLKTLSEDILIDYHSEVIQVFNKFSTEEKIDEEINQEQLACHLLIATVCFLQRKLKGENICRKVYFFRGFQVQDIFQNFEDFSIEKKVYIIDVFYQIAFLKKHFTDKKSMFKSIFNLEIVDDSLTLTSDQENLDKVIKEILNIIGLRFFTKIEKKKFSKIVKFFIESVRIVELPDSLYGLTLMNSSVLINSRCLSMHKKLSDNGRFPVCNAFIIMTCVHEFGHFIQRVDLKKKNEWFSYESPEDYIRDFSEAKDSVTPTPRNSESPKSKKSLSSEMKNRSVLLSKKSPSPSKDLPSLKRKESSPKKCTPSPQKSESSPSKGSSSPCKSVSSFCKEVSCSPKGISSPFQSFASPILRISRSSPELKHKIKNTLKASGLLSSEDSASLGSQNILGQSANEIAPIEGGSQLITAIFGFEPETLNYYDSVFIANPKNWELSENEFRTKFKDESSRESPKKFKKFLPVCCSQIKSIFPVRLGQCGNSRH